MQVAADDVAAIAGTDAVAAGVLDQHTSLAVAAAEVKARLTVAARADEIAVQCVLGRARAEDAHTVLAVAGDGVGADACRLGVLDVYAVESVGKRRLVIEPCAD